MKYVNKRYELYYDNFNYYNLITKIDRDYRLCFDNIEKLFIIINIAKNNQICLKFKSFSFNLIKSLQKTRVENSKFIFDEIDSNNNKIILDNHKVIKNKAIDSLHDLIKFSNRTNTISKTDINKIVEGKNA